jgi:hypothetical protein
VHAYDTTRDPASFRIPAHVIADLECFSHDAPYRVMTSAIFWSRGLTINNLLLSSSAYW